MGLAPPSPSNTSPHFVLLLLLLFTEPALPRPESEGTQILGRALPFGFRPSTHPTSPYLCQMGAQMCGRSSPHYPRPWESGLRLSFSHLHARLGDSGHFAPGCGAAPGHMGRLYGRVAGSWLEEGWPDVPPTSAIQAHSFAGPLTFLILPTTAATTSYKL